MGKVKELQNQEKVFEGDDSSMEEEFKILEEIHIEEVSIDGICGVY